MKTIYKKYVSCNGREVNNLRVELYYDLGGMNYFTSKVERRGYYLSVTPVSVSRSSYYTSEQSTAFSGIKVLLREADRQSKKAENIASIIAETREADLIDYVCRSHSITILSEEKGA